MKIDRGQIQFRDYVPTSPAYGVFISQLIRYARACYSYGCFIMRATRLSNKLLEQGYVKERLKSSLRKFYGRYGDLIKQYEVSLTQMLNDILWPDHIQWQPPTDQTLYRTRPFTEFWFATGVACRQGTLTPPDTWSRPFGTCICSTCWDQSFSELVVILPDYALRISLGTFSILLSTGTEPKIIWCSRWFRKPPISFEAVYVAQYRVICLVRIWFSSFNYFLWSPLKMGRAFSYIHVKDCKRMGCLNADSKGSWNMQGEHFLCRLRSIAAHRDYFARRVSEHSSTILRLHRIFLATRSDIVNLQQQIL